eukprot:TRINITY_DN48361_c0_g1_i1.p1 TRINITY_DN48361_c0_g1~~TRINITY_DN48361_c0_g1_i1.p1  ORF type:complete len:826 (-),score=149.19 TRINITY_DN48361_c0_g1_i1:15-2492(-)
MASAAIQAGLLRISEDGMLERSYLRAVLEDTDRSLWTDENFSILMHLFDTDNNGRIQIRSFLQWLFASEEVHEVSESKVLKMRIPWSAFVPVPARYCAGWTSIALTEQRAITLEQVDDLVLLVREVLGTAEVHWSEDAEVEWESINMYFLGSHFLKPLTAHHCCSFTELVAAGPQPPQWFVSHWWGTPFQQTHSLLNFHALRRELPVSTAYWICTFANNQHDLSGLAGSLLQTPFVKAILSKQCMGTLTLFDNKVTTFTRIWCVLENFVSTTLAKEAEKERSHLMDIAAWLPAGSGIFGGEKVPAKATLCMDLGGGRVRMEVDDQKTTGGAFPLSVSMKGVQMCLENADTSRREDKCHILHLIAGTPEDLWDSTEPPESSPNYAKLNMAARKMFVSGALYGATLGGKKSDMQLLASLLQEFPDRVDDHYNGAAPLYVAAWKNRQRVLQLLLNSRADPNGQKQGGASAILIATQSGHSDVVGMLLQADADPNLSRDDGFGPLLMAAQQGKSEILRMLLLARADAAASDQVGRTPMHLAAQKGDTSAVRILLSFAADPNVRTNKGNSPYQLAIQALSDLKKKAGNLENHHEVVDALLEARANVDDPGAPHLLGDESPMRKPRRFDANCEDNETTATPWTPFKDASSLSASQSPTRSWNPFDEKSPTRQHNPLDMSMSSSVSLSPTHVPTSLNDTVALNSEDTWTLMFGNTRRWLETDEDIPEHERRLAPASAHWAEWSLEMRFESPEHAAYLKKVVYTLHRSFEVPVEETLQPPFKVVRRGWGCFPVAAAIHLCDGQVIQASHKLSFKEAENFSPLTIARPSVAPMP